MSDPRVLAGLEAQLRDRDERLGLGARSVGWKVGLNAPAVQEALGISETVVGHMTDQTLLEDAAEYDTDGATAVAVEAELALHLGAGGEIAAYGVAIEVVDIDLPFDDVERIVRENVFHRGVLLGTAIEQRPEQLALTVWLNGELAHELDAGAQLAGAADAVANVGSLLEHAGASLAAGEVVISGAIAPLVFVSPGDRVRVELAPLGSLEVSLS